MAFKIQSIPNTKVLFGESPLWDGRKKELIFTDCFAKSLCIFDPKTSTLSKKVVTLPGPQFNCVIVSLPYSNSLDQFAVSTSGARNEIVEFDWTTGQASRRLLDLKGTSSSSDLAFSDAKCDGKGRIWTGGGIFEDLGNLVMQEGKGEVFKFGRDEKSGSFTCSKEDGNFDLPNGLGFNADYNKLFWCDIHKKNVNLYDFDLEDGKLGNRKTLIDFKDLSALRNFYPDGLCVDVNGHPWIACWKGGCVIKVDGNTGQLLEKVPIPVTNVTSVAFGGDSFQTLYVTTTSVELSGDPVNGEPEAGKLFEIRNERDNSFRGFQEHFFNGV